MDNKKISYLKASDAAIIALFVAVISVCSFVCIPISPPFTLQILGVFLTLEVLGGKRGFLAVLVYILLGLLGAPIFSGFAGGIGHLFGATGGYIIGFIFSAAIIWVSKVFFKQSFLISFLSSVIALIACYAFGTSWFMLVYNGNAHTSSLYSALSICVIPYIIPDILKISLAVFIGKRINKAVKF